jgi:hypothetical protein
MNMVEPGIEIDGEVRRLDWNEQRVERRNQYDVPGARHPPSLRENLTGKTKPEYSTCRRASFSSRNLMVKTGFTTR